MKRFLLIPLLLIFCIPPASATEIDLPDDSKLVCWTRPFQKCMRACGSLLDCIGEEYTELLEEIEVEYAACEQSCMENGEVNEDGYVDITECVYQCKAERVMKLGMIPGFYQCIHENIQCVGECVSEHCTLVPDSTPTDPVGPVITLPEYEDDVVPF